MTKQPSARLRYGMAARLVEGKREEYLELHRNVWPGVEELLAKYGVHNFTIFILGSTILAYYEYVGVDHTADQLSLNAQPLVKEWLSLTAACQKPLDDRSEVANWEQFTEVWHLD